MLSPRDAALNHIMANDEITVVMESLGSGSGSQCAPVLVVFYGANLGSRYEIEEELMIGRGEDSQVRVDQESVSRRHACIRIHTDGQSVLMDLGSTNGTFVNDQRVQTSELRDGDLIRVGQTILKYLAGDNLESKYHEEIYRLTTIDGLTGAYNKRYLHESLERELNRSARYGRVLTLVLFDIDHFKAINDTHGHLAGDYILRNLASLVSANLRQEDLFARFGGEEFAIILPEIDGRDAGQVCEKLRLLVEAELFMYESKPLRITISLGIHTLTSSEKEGPHTAADAIAGADTNLYAAKQAGRNRVCQS